MGKRTGLVLEGGGLRAIYNAGVLDLFQDLTLEGRFDYVIGTSAGAANASSFLAGQKGRNKRVIIDLLTTKDFTSIGRLLRMRPYMDLDHLFKDIAYKIDPLDIKAMIKNPAEFEVAATDILSGKAVYFEKKDKDFITAMKASCALPLLFQDPVKFKGYELFDGGLGDPIPVRRAVKRGCDKVVVVLTQHKGYRKTPSIAPKLLWPKYHRHHEFMQVLYKRHERYNATLEYVRRPPKGVSLFPIYPSKPLHVARLEKDRDTLEAAWSMGYRDAKKVSARLMRFLDA